MSSAAPRVGFILLSNSRDPIPSTRIAALNMFAPLRAAGYAPEVAWEPPNSCARPNLDGLLPRLLDYQIVVFQKVQGPSVETLARQLSAAGVTTVFAVCDDVAAGMADACRLTLAVTGFLKAQYPPALQHKIRVVHDGIEQPELHKTDWGSHTGSRWRPLHAVLVTSAHLLHLPVLASPPPWLRVTIVGRYAPGLLPRLSQMRWDWQQQRAAGRTAAFLRFMATPGVRCRAWHPQRVYRQLLDADLAIIPSDPQGSRAWQVKSENRLSMKMSLGLPVVATPIPSYLPLVRQGENAFLADSPQQWLDCLQQLRDPARRAAVGQAARHDVLPRYSSQHQAELFIAALDSLR